MATYKIDPAHSEVGFKIKHLMIASVSGSIKKFDATMESEKSNFSDASVTFEADADSVTTGQEQRDAHLKNDDFFNVEQYPKITFKSTGLKKISDDEYKLTGNLTIRDVTKPIELKVTYNGNIKDPWGFERAGFEIEGKINRQDYNLKWNALTETGGFVVGSDVKIHANAEMVKQPGAVSEPA
ncbi:MAG: YceI family protein [Chitinophagaceae bacterium]